MLLELAPLYVREIVLVPLSLHALDRDQFPHGAPESLDLIRSRHGKPRAISEFSPAIANWLANLELGPALLAGLSSRDSSARSAMRNHASLSGPPAGPTGPTLLCTTHGYTVGPGRGPDSEECRGNAPEREYARLRAHPGSCSARFANSTLRVDPASDE